MAILAFHHFFKAVNKAAQLNLNTFSTICPHWTTSTNISHVWGSPGRRHVTFSSMDGSVFEIRPWCRSVCCCLTQSVNQIDKSEMESKVRVPSSCPLACHPPADVIDMTKKPDGIVATAVISRAKWAHVGSFCRYRSALDQKDSFQQTALHGS